MLVLGTGEVHDHYGLNATLGGARKAYGAASGSQAKTLHNPPRWMGAAAPLQRYHARRLDDPTSTTSNNNCSLLVYYIHYYDV